MNAMHLALFCHSYLIGFVKSITKDAKATGIFNLIGNKGGLAIGIQLVNATYAFINCHFASG